ncbi:MAG: lipase family protein [Clostridia bacterium]|nr:lipase family protein [Clostridia bacterium]
MTLFQLFSTCLTIPYEKVGVSANYATRREGDTLYIFFEGSDGKRDWKDNLDFPVKPYKRMEKTVWFAHRGFLRVWKEIEPFLADKIADKSLRKIVVAGYSHGGALASLCHEYVWYHRPHLRDVIEGYGFGAPRVFWGIRTKKVKERWKNFVVVRNIDDLVTHLPPAFLGFSHVGSLLKIGKKGQYTAVSAHVAQNILKELWRYENRPKG